MGPGMTGMITRIPIRPPIYVQARMEDSGQGMMKYGSMVRTDFREMRMTGLYCLDRTGNTVRKMTVMTTAGNRKVPMYVREWMGFLARKTMNCGWMDRMVCQARKMMGSMSRTIGAEVPEAAIPGAAVQRERRHTGHMVRGWM